MRSRTIKRALDILGGIVGLALGAIPMAVIAVVVRFTMGSPVLFRQVRPGLDGQPFTLLKFRTMRSGDGSDAERMTKVGNLLRSTSLDELPEFWNVLVGDMSLVGPRPLLMDYLPLYDETQRRRHEVRPGLTGFAQVAGRNLVDWPERFAMDVEYVDTWTIGGDIKIIAQTLAAVVHRTGVQAEGEVTMKPFTGNAPIDEGGS
jgi:lipopolysaccharide/colanic/teichoic acid biosynthesis glycosyltransferase